MITLLQRVSRAEVVIDGTCVGPIDRGVLAFVGVVASDAAANTARPLECTLGYRAFADDRGRMNLSVQDAGGGLLLVRNSRSPPIPTKVCDRASHPPRRPSAAAICSTIPQIWPAPAARPLRPAGSAPMCGSRLTNDGPVAFWLEA